MRTRDCPPVDLLIRTSGEQRLSDFLLWQSSHALLHWEECLWPDFGFVHLLRALVAWQKAQPHLAALRQSAAAAAVAVQQQRADDELAQSLPVSADWLQQQQQETAAQQQHWLGGRDAMNGRPECPVQWPQQEQPVLLGRSPERSLSQGLSAISEDDEVFCPHPSQQLRVQNFLSRVDREHWQRVMALAANS